MRNPFATVLVRSRLWQMVFTLSVSYLLSGSAAACPVGKEWSVEVKAAQNGKSDTVNVLPGGQIRFKESAINCKVGKVTSSIVPHGDVSENLELNCDVTGKYEAKTSGWWKGDPKSNSTQELEPGKLILVDTKTRARFEFRVGCGVLDANSRVIALNKQ